MNIDNLDINELKTVMCKEYKFPESFVDNCILLLSRTNFLEVAPKDIRFPLITTGKDIPIFVAPIIIIEDIEKIFKFI